jgi:LysM repeat protein
VMPGDHLRFSMYQEGWSTGTNDPYHSDLGQRMNLQVGIDPTGGNNPWSPNIIWSAPAESFDEFTQFTVDAIAKNNVVSVWTKSKPNMPLEHVDVYVDEASLNVVTGGAKAAKAAPAKTTRTSKIITSTKVITSGSGITSTVIVTKTIYVTVPVTSTLPTKPITGTVGTTVPVTGTLPIPASGTYTVVKGDSLSKIARRFGVSLAALIALNSITDPNRIEAGMVLKLK